MKYRKLGTLENEVSEVGFGTWGLGGDSYGPAPETDAIAALRLAFESGINFYDTSDLYGNGRSESLLGKAFKNERKNVVIATKVGFIPGTKDQDFSIPHIEKSLEASLKRLQTDYIDLYQLHSPAIEELENDAILKTLEDFQKAGKIRAIGLSVRRPNDGLVAIEKYGLKSIQVNFNLIDQRPMDLGLFEVAKKNGAGIIARTPLCFGFLTGKYTENMAFSDIDHRTQWPKDQIERWAKAPEYFKSLYQGSSRGPIGLALQYCLAFKEVSSVIPGMMTPDHVRENLAAVEASKALTAADLNYIRETYLKNFSAPPTRKG